MRFFILMLSVLSTSAFAQVYNSQEYGNPDYNYNHDPAGSSPQSYLPSPPPNNTYGAPNGVGNGANGWDNRQYVPAGADPNPTPNVMR